MSLIMEVDNEVKCENCEEYFGNKTEYYVHANEAHQAIVAKFWYECGHCKMHFPSLEVRDEHRAEVHLILRRPSARVAAKRTNILSTSKCQLCGHIFQSQLEISEHFRKVHPDSSSKRSSVGRPRRQPIPPAFTQVDVETNGFLNCPFCEEIFAELSDFTFHVNESHSTEVQHWISCAICKQHFPNQGLREKHKKECYDKSGSGDSKVCEFCSEILIDKYFYIQHGNNAHLEQIQDTWFSCDSCQLYFPDDESLQEHEELAHQGKDRIISSDVISCEFCAKTFLKTFFLYHHINMEHRQLVEDIWLPCDECEKIWPTDEVLVQHKGRAHKKRYKARGKRLKNCDFCDKTFCDSSEFYRHANTFHREDIIDEWLPCSECATLFPDPAVIRNHKIKAHPELGTKDESVLASRRRDRTKRLAYCEFCDKNLCDTTELYRHANHFHKDSLKNWISCNLCEMLFPDETVIRNHKGRVHPGSLEPRRSTVTPSAASRLRDASLLDESKVFDCKFCTDFKCTSQQSFYRHANKDHLDLILDSWFLCEPCDLRFPTSLILERHNVKVHQAGRILNVMCDFCNKTFPRYQQLVTHANRSHKDEISESWGQCQTCSVHFPTSELLTHHLKRAHVAKKNPDEKLQCPFCPATLSTLASYYAHANDRHSERLANGEGGWPQCLHCDLFFPTKDILNNHVNHRHNKENKGPREKTKICKFCKAKFNHPMLVYAHIAEAHRSLVEKDWHYCDKCEVFFPTKLGLTFHMLRSKHISHKVKDVCPFCSNTFKGKGKMYRHANRLHKDLLPQHWLLCGLCNSYLPDEVTLASHTVNAHQRQLKGRKNPTTNRQESSVNAVAVDDLAEAAEFVECSFCTEVLTSMDHYYQHCSKMHQNEIINDWKACDHCHLFLPDMKTLHDHLQQDHQHDSAAMMSSAVDDDEAEMLLITEVPAATHEEQIELETSEIVVEIVESDQPTEIHHCSICSDTFFKPQLFYKHSNEMHLESIVDTWLMCTVCKMFYPGMSVLKTHMATAHAPMTSSLIMRITCTICMEAFDKTADFYWHANQMHTDMVAANWFPCDTCSFFFPETDTLEQHKAFFHPKQL